MSCILDTIQFFNGRLSGCLLPASLNVISNHFSCWLSVQDGFIWAFLGPMLAIVVVRIIILTHDTFVNVTRYIIRNVITVCL